MLDNKKKFSKSKKKLRRSEANYKKLLDTEKTKYDSAVTKIKGDKKLTQTQKRDKIAKVQLQRRMKEKAARQRMEKLQQTHSANETKYKGSQKRQMQKYRQRKRAIEFADRNTKRTAYTKTSTRRYGPTNVIVATQPGYAQPGYGYAGARGTMIPPPPLQGYGGPAPMNPDYPQEPQPASSIPSPEEGAEEFTDVENEEYVEGGMSTSRPPRQQRAFNIIKGVDEDDDEEIEMIDIPALQELDSQALRDFLRARMNFERAVTQDEKIKYSIIFFDLAKKLDRMFHLHTDLWHKIMKYRPKEWSVMDANQFTDTLPKEEVERLSALPEADLRAYLQAV